MDPIYYLQIGNITEPIIVLKDTEFYITSWRNINTFQDYDCWEDIPDMYLLTRPTEVGAPRWGILGIIQDISYKKLYRILNDNLYVVFEKTISFYKDTLGCSIYHFKIMPECFLFSLETGKDLVVTPVGGVNETLARKDPNTYKLHALPLYLKEDLRRMEIDKTQFFDSIAVSDKYIKTMTE